jgi:hypothetical protein
MPTNARADPEAWNALLEETVQEFQPETPFEHRIIREIAFTKWRLQRAWHIEQSLMNNEVDTRAEDLDTKHEDLKKPAAKASPSAHSATTRSHSPTSTGTRRVSNAHITGP